MTGCGSRDVIPQLSLRRIDDDRAYLGGRGFYVFAAFDSSLVRTVTLDLADVRFSLVFFMSCG